MIRHPLFLCLALVALGLAAAAAERILVASGVSGGTYRGVYAQALEDQLSEHTVIHRLSSGSGENLEMLAAGRVDFAFAQADVFAIRLREQPDRFASFEVLGRLGAECLFVAVRKTGAVNTFAELATPIEGRPAEIAIGPPQSGSSGTWNHLVLLSPELSAALTHPVGDRVALRYLERGTFDAVVWVTDPTNLEHRMLRAVRDSAQLELMAVPDAELTATLPDGTHVYEAGRVKLETSATAIPTVCTSAVLLGRGDLDEALLTEVRRMRGLRRMTPSP